MLKMAKWLFSWQKHLSGKRRQTPKNCFKCSDLWKFCFLGSLFCLYCCKDARQNFYGHWNFLAFFLKNNNNSTDNTIQKCNDVIYFTLLQCCRFKVWFLLIQLRGHRTSISVRLASFLSVLNSIWRLIWRRPFDSYI